MRIALLTTGGTVAMQASDKGASLSAPPPFAKMLERARIALAILLSNGAAKKDIAAFFGGL